MPTTERTKADTNPEPWFVRSPELTARRRRLGAILRLALSGVFIVWALIDRPGAPLFVAPLVGYMLLSMGAVFWSVSRKCVPLRYIVMSVADVGLTTYFNYLLGAQDSLLVVLYLLILVAYLLHEGYLAGVIALVLSLSSYMGVLLLENHGVLPPAPLAGTEPDAIGIGPGGGIWGSFATLSIAMLGVFAFISITLARIDDFAKNEQRLRRSKHEANEESQVLHERLAETARLEGLGRLAGGVAHDFNNLLSVILGYGRELRDEMPLKDQRREDLSEMVAAAEQAAELTRGLLAFSRRQVVSKVVTDPNKLIRGMGKIMDRLIGEDVQLESQLDADVGRIEVDPSQMEQVLMNLVVNAKDAMPEGGKVILGTSMVDLKPEDCAQRADLQPGRYVEVSVMDSGIGMDLETAEKIFEPFFTTKGVGEGTGLGLSMVYGIVRQHGGHVELTTAPGEGSRFNVRLPVSEADMQERDSRPSLLPWEGNETILIVEDEPAVRKATHRLLHKTDYKILEAGSGEEAYQLARAYEGEIHLLLTDVIMPGMTGKELAQKLAVTRPEMRVLFMSGYPSEVLGKKGVIPREVAFIAKPIDAKKLKYKIDRLLDSESAAEMDR